MGLLDEPGVEHLVDFLCDIWKVVPPRHVGDIVESHAEAIFPEAQPAGTVGDGSEDPRTHFISNPSVDLGDGCRLALVFDVVEYDEFVGPPAWVALVITDIGARDIRHVGLVVEVSACVTDCAVEGEDRMEAVIFRVGVLLMDDIGDGLMNSPLCVFFVIPVDVDDVIVKPLELDGCQIVAQIRGVVVIWVRRDHISGYVVAGHHAGEPGAVDDGGAPCPCLHIESLIGIV